MKRILISFILAMPVFVSCSGIHEPEPTMSFHFHYEDYQAGMYVNGARFHNLNDGMEYGFWGHTRDLTVAGEDPIVYISGRLKDMAPMLSKHRYDDRLDVSFALFVHSSAIKDNMELTFTAQEGNLEQLIASWYDGALTQDIARAVLVDSEGLEFKVKEGTISFSNFTVSESLGNNKEYTFGPASFEFVAESYKGDILTVTKGYCKAYKNIQFESEK